MGGGSSTAATTAAHTAELERLQALTNKLDSDATSRKKMIDQELGELTASLDRQRQELEAARKSLAVQKRAVKDELALLAQHKIAAAAYGDLTDVENIRHSITSTNNPLDLRDSPEGVTTVSTTTASSVANLVPVTYAEAFSEVGGEAALNASAELHRLWTAEPGAEHRRVADVELAEAVAGMLPRDYRQRLGYSTIPLNQDYMPTLDALYVRAERVLPLFNKRIRRIAASTGAEALVAPLKGKKRAEMKAAFKYRDSGGGIAYYRLTDVVRATLVFADISSMYKGLAAVVDDFGRDCRELNDRYQAPLAGDYRDIQVVVWFEGMLCELQINTEPMLRAKKTTGHRDYELVRELVAAVAEGDLGRVRVAFEWGQENLGSAANVSNVLLRGDGQMLLHAAARRGDAEIVRCFLENGADANAEDEGGNTPLHLAVAGGHERAIWVLLNVGGASTSKENAAGRTALLDGFLMLRRQPGESATRGVMTLAYATGATEVKRMKAKADEELKKLYHNSRPLVDAAADGNIEKALEELRAFADPDSLDANGKCALAVALAAGRTEMVELLEAWLARTPYRLRADEGLSIDDVLARGFAPSALKTAGFSFRELFNHGVPVSVLQSGEYGQEVKRECGSANLSPFDLIIGETVQLRNAYWVNKGEDGRLYASTLDGPDGHTRRVLTSKPKDRPHMLNKADWIVQQVPGKPGQAWLRSAHWVESGEDGRMYSSNYVQNPKSSTPTQRVLMSKPKDHLTSTKGDWLVEAVPGNKEAFAIQLKCSHWVEKGHEGLLYAATYDDGDEGRRQ